MMQQATEASPYLRSAAAAWARLWGVYNALLIAEGLAALLVLRAYAQVIDHPCEVLFGMHVPLAAAAAALLANGCFCFGPLIDYNCYANHGLQLGRGRDWLFAAGLIAVMLVIAGLATSLGVHVSRYG